MAGNQESVWRENEGNREQEQQAPVQASLTPQMPPMPREGYTVVPGWAAAETEETKRMKGNYGFIAPAALCYGLLYAFCMYRNGSGIAFGLFVAGSLVFFYHVLKRIQINGGNSQKPGCAAGADGSVSAYEKGGSGGRERVFKKGSVFYIAAMALLSISTFCTDDGTLIFFNKFGIFLLMMSFLLKQFFHTSKWKLGKYLGSICILVGASIGELGRPFSDGAAHNKARGKRMGRRGWYIALGLLVGIPLVMVILLLLASADAVFGEMTKKLLHSISLAGIFDIVFRVVSLFFGAYALTAYLCKKRIREDVADMRKGEPVLAVTVTGLLTLIYLLFSVVQIAGLFLGKLQLPEGYTYAMYARRGFFQLLLVSVLNLVIVLGCLNYFRESKVLKGVLTVMSFCTFIMIASSFMRMIMYIRYYYLTYLRILVLWGLVVLAVLFAGVVASIVREGFPLFRYSMAAVAVLYLALSFAHPDYIIARVNVANAPHGDMLLHQEGEEWSEGELNGRGFFLVKEPYLDYAYLRTLSADAAPVLVPYLRELGYDMKAFDSADAVEYAKEEEILGSYGAGRSDQAGFGYYWMRKMQGSTKNFGLRTYNVSRHIALHHLAP